MNKINGGFRRFLLRGQSKVGLKAARLFRIRNLFKRAAIKRKGRVRVHKTHVNPNATFSRDTSIILFGKRAG